MFRPEAQLEAFAVLGISYHKADTQTRSRFHLSPEQADQLMQRLHTLGAASLVLCTCNRTEVYAHGISPEALRTCFALQVETGPDALDAQGAYLYTSTQALAHLFRVSAGLDSMILGDLQIGGQLYKSYARSKELGYADAFLHRVMQHVRKGYKRIRTETGLSRGAASVAHAAVLYMRQHACGRRILLVGTGKMGKVTCKNLLSDPALEITLINRNSLRAQRFAQELGGNIRVATWESLTVEVARHDVVIVATGAQEPVLHHSHLTGAAGCTRWLIDLSVPRNISDDVRSLPFVRLATLDELSQVTDETLKARQAAIPQAEAIIEHEQQQFLRWVDSLQVTPVIKALTEKLHQLRRAELASHGRTLDVQQLAHVDRLTQGIVDKIAAWSIHYLKETADPQEASETISRMFQLELNQDA
jgi:glutamyl-tRNA reductase